MVFRLYKWNMKMAAHNKFFLFWNLMFPIILGTLFFSAFNSIYESEKFDTIPIAIVGDSEHYIENALKEIEFSDNVKMFSIKKLDEKNATNALKSKEISGIIDAKDYSDVKMDIAEDGVNQSIIAGVVTSIRSGVEPSEYVKDKNLAANNPDPYIQYMYSLITMVCILASTSVLMSLSGGDARSSDSGVRVESSPVGKFTYQMSCVMSAFSFQIGIIGLMLIYLIGILGINFGANPLVVFGTAVVGNLLGCALGYLVSSLFETSTNMKNGILLVITLFGGFMSGLMVADIRILIEENIPIVNRINPSAIITDAFYSLNVYGVGDRYYYSIIWLLLVSIAMFAIGAVVSYWKTYRYKVKEVL